MRQMYYLVKEFNKIKSKEQSVVKIFPKESSLISIFYSIKENDIIISMKASDNVLDKRKYIVLEWFGKVEEWNEICRRYGK